MSNQLVIEGLAELRAALRELPDQLKNEAAGIIEGRAETAAANIEAGYPSRTGNLRKGVRVTKARTSPFGAAAVVVNRAKHAYIFERGTQARHTAIGANRGAMPPGRVFIPETQKQRALMWKELGHMVEEHGLQVTGDAE